MRNPDAVPPEAEAMTAAIQAAARTLTRIAFDMVYRDPHQWSKRPCQTCSAITALIGIEFGCDRWREEMNSVRR